MVNRKELAICKRRGHDALTIDDAWRQCKWCGLWLRKVTTIEEREDEPPKNEQSLFQQLNDRLGIGKKEGGRKRGSS